MQKRVAVHARHVLTETNTKRNGETMSNTQQLNDLNTKKQVAEWARCSTRNIELQVKSNKFPKPIRLGSSPRWRRSDLEKWMNEQV